MLVISRSKVSCLVPMDRTQIQCPIMHTNMLFSFVFEKFFLL